ncbi:MAG: hypothetical protein ACE5OZ_17075 [Candidatus Heimdallarchaeota archaeon]
MKSSQQEHNLELGLKLISRGTTILMIMNIALFLPFSFVIAGFLDSVHILLLLNIDVIGFLCLGMGMFITRDIDKTTEKMSKSILVLLGAWSGITLLVRTLMASYFDLDHFFDWEYDLPSENSFFVSLTLIGWIIAITLLSLAVHQIKRLLVILDETMTTGMYTTYIGLNLLSIFPLVMIIAVYNLLEPTSDSIPNLFLWLAFLKLLILPPIGLILFHSLKNDLKHAMEQAEAGIKPEGTPSERKKAMIVKGPLVTEDFDLGRRFLRLGARILYIQQLLILLLIPVASATTDARPWLGVYVVLLSIDIIAFLSIGLGFYFWEKIKPAVGTEIKRLLVMLCGWAIFTLINRSLIIAHLFAHKWLYRGEGDYPEEDPPGWFWEYPEDLFFFFVTWLIALLFLSLSIFLIAGILRKLNPTAAIRPYMLYASGNLVSILCVATFASVFRGGGPFSSFGMALLLAIFAVFKFIIIPILGINLCNKLEKDVRMAYPKGKRSSA